MKIKSSVMMTALLSLFAIQVHASTITFGDTSIRWPGWGGGVSPRNHSLTDNSRDTIGSPYINGGSLSVTGSTLDAVSINYGMYETYRSVTPGDLFIDVGANNDWDYVIDTSTRNIYSFAPGAFLLGSTTGYLYSGDWDNWAGSGPNSPGVWKKPLDSNPDIRDDHPVLYNVGGVSGTLLGQATITPLRFYSGKGTNLTFTYSDLGLDLAGRDLIIGWTIDCANDVLYQKVTTPAPVPATLLLLGSGLLALAGFRRKIST